jgi:hypothetical protein
VEFKVEVAKGFNFEGIKKDVEVLFALICMEVIVLFIES